MKINLRESLNKIDLATDNKYDLLNTFDSKKLSDNSKKKLAEAIDNNSMASVNKILHESEEQLFKVVIQSGATKRDFESALYEDEAEGIVDYYGGRWIDENGFEWNMYVEEDDESTERVYPFEESLNEARIIEPKYKDGDIVFVGDADGYHGTFLIKGDFKNIPKELYHNIRRIYKYGNLDKPYYKVEYKIDSNHLFEEDYRKFFEYITPILKDANISILRSEEDDDSTEHAAIDNSYDERAQRECVESLNEASYGGAYDIEDDMYFTKEEIVEFAYNICEDLAKEFGYKYDIADVYMDSPTKLHIELIDNHDIEVDINVRIDMRRIRKPSDLEKAYYNSTLESFKNRFLEEYQYYEFDESLKESIDISDYEELHYPLRDGNKYYQLYRKIENGKGVWAAAELDKYGSDVVGEPFKITYEQARGFEPIEDSSIRKLSRDLGKKLLPKRENLNEAYRPLAIGYMILKKEVPNHVNYAEFANYDEVVTAIPSEGDVVVYPRGGKISGTDIAYWQFDAIDSEGKKTKANFSTYIYLLKDYLNNDEMELKLIPDFKLIDEYPYLIEVDDDIEESLKEAIDDEIDLDYETDFDDNEVEEGNHVFADGEEYVWVERIAGPIYLDFDKWAVWSARVFVDPREFMTIHDNGKGYDFDGDAFKEKAMAAPIVYFVVEEDTGFIDWGPVESRIEAQDFLNGKQEDWDNDEYYGESLEKNLDEWYVHTLHYEDIGNGREYDYEVDHEEVLDYLSEIAIDEEDAPEDTEEYLKWVEDNFDELFNKYEYEIEEHFREDASQEEYNRRHSSYESEYDPMD